MRAPRGASATKPTTSPPHTVGDGLCRVGGVGEPRRGSLQRPSTRVRRLPHRTMEEPSAPSSPVRGAGVQANPIELLSALRRDARPEEPRHVRARLTAAPEGGQAIADDAVRTLVRGAVGKEEDHKADLSAEEVALADLDGDGRISARELRLFRMAVDASVKAATGIATTATLHNAALAHRRTPVATSRIVRAHRPAYRRSYARKTFGRPLRTRLFSRAGYRRRF